MKLGNERTGEATAAFSREVASLSGVQPAHCYQCGKCTAGCPITFAMDIDPARVMRLIQLGQRAAVLDSHTIWLCASCETCTARCPQEIDLARVMDTLRIMARVAGRVSAEREVAIANKDLLAGVKSAGRVHETALVLQQNLKTLRLFRDAEKAPLLLGKGKLALRGHKSGNRKQVRRLFENVERLEGGDG